MEQVYFVGKSGAPGTGARFTSPQCLYRYGRFCYSGPVELATGVPSVDHLPSVMRYLQSIQGTIPYVAEFDNLAKASQANKSALDCVVDAVEFIKTELGDLEEVLGEYLHSEAWLNDPDVNLFFEFETHSDYTCALTLLPESFLAWCRTVSYVQNAEVVFAKTFASEIMLSVIWYRNTFYVTISAAAQTEQALVDTLFPNIYGKQRSLQLRTYDHPIFNKLMVWEATGLVPDPALGRAPGQAAASGTGRRSGGTEDLQGEGYSQVYCVMKPDNAGTGNTRRRALFRFGNWCYGGEVDFGVQQLNLGDVPDVLPTLQKQQGNLAYLCEIAKFPSDSPFAPVLAGYKASTEFLTATMLSVEEQLSALAEQGLTAWLNEDWSASFFELAYEIPEELAHVEVIASKQYTSVGVVLHCVWFAGSLYCVLADAKDDQPLLDVAFPDVTARCRGVQVKSFTEADLDGEPKDLPTPKRLSVWEGRRRGVPGVGWGTVAAVKEDQFRSMMGGASVSEGIREAARKRAERDTAAAAASTSLGSVGSSTSKHSGGVPSTAAATSSAQDSKTAEPEPVLAAEAASDSKVAQEAAPTDSKEAEPTDAAAASSGGVSMGGGGALSPVKGGGNAGFRVGGAKAPHHLPSMGGGAGRLRQLGPAKLGALGGGQASAPWSADGRPVLGSPSKK